EQLGAASFFRFLRPSWLAVLADRAIVTKAPRGSTITTEGSVSDALYMIVSGEITVSEGALGAGRDAGAKANANQRRDLVGRERAGTVFGVGPLTTQAEVHTRESLSDVVLLHWDRAVLGEIFEREPGLERQLKTRISLRTRHRELVDALRRSILMR